MVYVGICDDEEKCRIRIKEFCDIFFKETGIDWNCLFFANSEEVEKYNGEKMMLLFLDIEMGEMDGLELLKRLEKQQKVWRVVFATSHVETAISAFGIRTLGFKVKPVEYNDVKEMLEIALAESGENKIITVKTGNGEMGLSVDEIDYVEGYGNYSCVWKGDERIMVDGNIRCLEKKTVGTTIVRCHKSYMVNISKIYSIVAKEIRIDENKRIPLGRAYKQQTVSRRQEFLCRLAEGRLRK